MCLKMSKIAVSLKDDAKLRHFFGPCKFFGIFFSFYPKFFHFLYKIDEKLHIFRVLCIYFLLFSPLSFHILNHGHVCTHICTHIAIQIRTRPFKAIFSRFKRVSPYLWITLLPNGLKTALRALKWPI